MPVSSHFFFVFLLFFVFAEIVNLFNFQGQAGMNWERVTRTISDEIYFVRFLVSWENYAVINGKNILNE